MGCRGTFKICDKSSALGQFNPSHSGSGPEQPSPLAALAFKVKLAAALPQQLVVFNSKNVETRTKLFSGSAIRYLRDSAAPRRNKQLLLHRALSSWPSTSDQPPPPTVFPCAASAPAPPVEGRPKGCGRGFGARRLGAVPVGGGSREGRDLRRHPRIGRLGIGGA